jgi:hypothetical protein
MLETLNALANLPLPERVPKFTVLQFTRGILAFFFLSSFCNREKKRQNKVSSQRLCDPAVEQQQQHLTLLHVRAKPSVSRTRSGPTSRT